MPILFNEKHKILTLETENTSYQMKIDDKGYLLHTWYGAKINANDDLSYRIFAIDRGFSGNPYETKDRTYSLDYFPQEYSCYGNGDYRSDIVILILISITMLVPFIWMILTAFKTVTESTSVNPFVIFPKKWITANFKIVINNMNFINLYINTFLLISGRVLCAVLTATTAGYAFARLEFPGRKMMFSLVLFQMMVPGQIFIIPQYLMVSKLGMSDTVFALVFPGLVSAFGTFLLRQGFMSLPKDLEEAARIDGCNIGQTFLYIMMPLVRSGMVALGIFTAVFAYKDLMWPMIVNKTVMPLSAALAKMQGQYGNNYPQLMTASLLACLPMIVLYLLFQRQFIEGIATSGGKL